MADVKAPGNWVVSSKFKAVTGALMALGLVAFILGLAQDNQRAWASYLIGLFYFTSLALGGLFFTTIQHVTKAGWSVNIRRFCESFASFLPYTLVGAVILLLGVTVFHADIYEWMHHEVVAKDPILSHKAAYLNVPFFVVRTLIFFVAWVLFSRVILGRSLQQDQDGDENHTHKLVGISVGFLGFFAISYSLFSVDTLMSLEPHWFSTMFGVYTFSGLFQSTIAFMIIMVVYLQKKGLLTGFVTNDHLHDLGKFLFAFTVFWAYIAYSQYMLIWYANLPEETFYFITRSQKPWVYISMALIVFKFIVPFFLLLPKAAKRNGNHLVAVSLLILIMQAVDLYWLVYPAISKETLTFGFTEVGSFLGFLGLFLWVISKFLSKNSLIPMKDPRRHESMHHHVVY